MQQAPAIGTEMDGHRFKGGNPADRNSWEPIGAAAWGPGAQELPNGAVVRYGPRGGMTTLRAATTIAGADPSNPLYIGQGAVGGLSAGERDSLLNNRTAAQQAESRLSNINRFEAINREARTGGIEDPISAIPVLRALTPKNRQMRSITNMIAPTLRGAGSGAMSDKDLETFKTSIPNVGELGNTNRDIAARLRAGSMRERDYAAFMDEFARANGTTFGAQEKWDAYKNDHPLYDPERGVVRQGVPSWRQYFGVQPPARRQTRTTAAVTPPVRTGNGRRGVGGANGFTPKQVQVARSIRGVGTGPKGARQNPHMVNSAREFNAVPSGQWLIDDDGKYVQKR